KTVLDGFTISGGKSASSSNTTSANYVGGGIYNANTASTPVFRNLIIKNNTAVNGAGMFNTGSPELIKVKFIGNATTSAYGGGLYNTGSPKLTEVEFSGNTAASYGGAMFTSGNPVLNSVLFSGNTARASGGALYVNKGSPILDKVVFRENKVTGNYYGGAMFIVSGTNASLSNVSFIANASTYSGGALYNAGHTALKNVVFSRNKVSAASGFYGGGMYTTTGTVSLTNVTFRSNTIAYANASATASYGGGLYRYSGTVNVSNSIFWN